MECVNGSAVMPEPAAGWGLTSLSGFLEGSVLNVFASNPEEEAKGAGDGGEAERENAGAMQVQTSTHHQATGLPQQQLCGATASGKPSRTASSASMESDLPELGRLERTKTLNACSVAVSDEEEPACRGGEVSSKMSRSRKSHLPSQNPSTRLTAFQVFRVAHAKLDF